MREAPDFYRGVKVPNVRKRYWTKPTMKAWREGIDDVLSVLLSDTQKDLEAQKERSTMCWADDWSEGIQYAREDEKEELIDKLKQLLAEEYDA